MSAPFTLPPALAAELEALLAPLTAPRPIAADERYQTIRQEIAKLESPLGATVDWRRIAELGSALLREAAKELLIAAYTALALAKLHGLPGVLLGLTALTRLLDDPALTPPRATSRARALDWYLARLRTELLAIALTPEHAPVVRALPAAARALRAGAQERLGDDAPSFGPVLQALEALSIDLLPAPGHAPNDMSSGSPELADASPAPPARAPQVPAPAPPAPQVPAPASPAPQVPALASPAPDPKVSPTSGVASPPAPSDVSSPPDPPGPLRALRDEAAPWLVPLDSAQPCGPDPVAHETFAEVRAEIQKLSAITETAVDWAMIEARSGELLQRHAKDLRLAVYFALARHRRAGLPGLALGATLIAELLDVHGAALHPRQARSRRMICEWLIGQVGPALRGAADPVSAPHLAALQAAWERLAAVLAARLGDDAPSHRPIREALAELAARNAPEPAPPEPLPSAASPPPATAPIDQAPLLAATETRAPAPAPTAPAPAPAPALPSAPPPAPAPAPTAPVLVQAAASVSAPADLSQVDRFLDATDDALVSTSRALREAQSSDPRAYRLLRIGIWLRMLAPPPTRPDGNTAVPGLAERDRGALDDLLARQRWLDLLHRSENLLRGHRLVLDLQRFSGVALANLGPDHAGAALALRAELCALLLRFPALPTLRDRDGRPLADPDTQRWLSEHVLPRSRGAQPVALADPDPDPAFWTDLPARLRGEARDAALAEARARIDQSPSRRLRFTRNLALAEAALDAGDHGFAALLFAALAAEADREALDHWDPPLVVRCLSGAARCHHRRGHPAARDHALERLSRLDAPTTAALLTELP